MCTNLCCIYLKNYILPSVNVVSNIVLYTNIESGFCTYVQCTYIDILKNDFISFVFDCSYLVINS